MIERTFDYRKVKKIAPWQPIISREVIYLLDNDKDLWAFHKYLDGLMIHAEMSVNTRGGKARESAKRAFGWIFKNTKAKTIYAGIPEDRKRACYMAILSGMKFTHVNENKRFYKLEEAQDG